MIFLFHILGKRCISFGLAPNGSCTKQHKHPAFSGKKHIAGIENPYRMSKNHVVAAEQTKRKGSLETSETP